jgi:hypothetical protein
VLEKPRQQYIVRSLELATRAFQDLLLSRAAKPSHDWHVQPVVKDQNRSPPERCVSVEPAIHSDSVSSKLVHLLRSSPTRRDEPFKLTAAVHVVSIFERAKCTFYRPAALLRRFWLFRDFLISRFRDFSIAKSGNHEIRRNAVRLLKISILRRLLRLAKPFRAGCFASAKLP